MSMSDDAAKLRMAATKAADTMPLLAGTDVVFDEVMELVMDAAGDMSAAMEVAGTIDRLHNLLSEAQQAAVLLATRVTEMADRAEGR